MQINRMVHWDREKGKVSGEQNIFQFYFFFRLNHCKFIEYNVYKCSGGAASRGERTACNGGWQYISFEEWKIWKSTNPDNNLLMRPASCTITRRWPLKQRSTNLDIEIISDIMRGVLVSCLFNRWLKTLASLDIQTISDITRGVPPATCFDRWLEAPVNCQLLQLNRKLCNLGWRTWLNISHPVPDCIHSACYPGYFRFEKVYQDIQDVLYQNLI